MNLLKYITAFSIILLIAVSCETDEDILYDLKNAPAPSNVSASFDITQDNTGLVTIYPNADGATKFRITFGDEQGETPTEYGINNPITHVYAEGQYEVKVEAMGITGLTSEYTQNINVSFNPPENLVINIENDPVVSKQVNISATAENTTVIDYYFGDVESEEPTTALPDEVVSHVYENAGDYDITVIARGAAIATLDSTFTFTVTEIMEPLEAAPEPPNRLASDVISIFSDAYQDVEDTDFNPNWGQSTISTIVEIEENQTLKYSNLNYQGTQFGSTVDASGMEYLHIDLWTVDAENVNVYPISISTGEISYDLNIVQGEWTSFDIPLSVFTDQGLSMADLHQFKFDGTGGSTIFLDNLYFYKESSAPVNPTLPLDFESETIDYDWTDFDGGQVTIMDNPHQTGINTSSKVAQMVKNPGQPWGGSYITLDNPIDFSTNKTFRMKLYSPRVGAKVLLKVENLTENGINHEVEMESTVANQWEEITFDYSGIDDTKSYQKIILIFDNGTAGDGSADFTFLIDDIELIN